MKLTKPNQWNANIQNTHLSVSFIALHLFALIWIPIHIFKELYSSYFTHTDLYNIFHGENVFDFSLLAVFSDSW